MKAQEQQAEEDLATDTGAFGAGSSECYDPADIKTAEGGWNHSNVDPWNIAKENINPASPGTFAGGNGHISYASDGKADESWADEVNTNE